MNKAQLKRLIKEEIKKVLNEIGNSKSSASANLHLTEAPVPYSPPTTAYGRVIDATKRPKGWLQRIQVDLKDAENAQPLKTDQETLPPPVEKKMI